VRSEGGDALNINYCYGTSKTDAYPKMFTAPNFDEFVSQVLAFPRARTKGRTYICAPLRRNGIEDLHRCKADVLPRWWLGADLDGGSREEVDVLLMRLSDYRAVAWQTASSTPEHPRWRIIVLLDREVDRAEGVRLGAALVGVLGDGLPSLKWDKSTHHGEQMCYLPLAGAQVMQYHGDPVDVDSILALAPEEPPRERQATPDPYEALIIEHGLFLHEIDASKAAITCPFEEDHSEKTSDSSTVYFRPLHGGYRWGRIFCSHTTHCTDRPQEDFIEKLGGDPRDVWRGQARETSTEPAYSGRGNGKDKGSGDASEERTGSPDKRIFHDSDFANARRLTKLHGPDLRFTPERAWIVWIGTRWVPDDQGRVMELAKDATKSIYDEIRDADEAARGELFKWARRSQSVERARAMLALTQSEPGIPARWTDFDADPWAVHLANGAFMHDSTLRPHRREDMMSRSTHVTYDKGARCPRWDSFLERVMPDTEARDYLQRAVGYSLTGSTREQCLFFLWGAGLNGKSVFLDVVLALIGDYGASTRIDTFMPRRPGDIPNDLARLAGARFVTVSETSEGARLNESLIKDVTGGDTICARFLHREFFDFKPQFKLWIRGNHKPQIRGTDEGIWRRIHLIPFLVKIPKEEQDKDLVEKLKGELPGILNWALEGCASWQAQGLNPPLLVTEATRNYREELDVVGRFLEECCDISKMAETRASDLYKAYTLWCEESREHAASQRTFGEALTEKGFERRRSGGIWYLGLRLR
jgi:P4 family phage/plasmid primase-like protien